ncbi:AMP-binding protein [Streptosporangium amethystogenes]|uniref:AMP-binding protein n=1 Tax=Streptosporangium amethystogenes TaxID=2002 RepID=UPI0037986326
MTRGGWRALPDLVEEAAARAPETTAVIGEHETTYGELARGVRAVAGRLAAAGVVPGDVVGLASGRSERAPALALGIMRAGAVYLPLDPLYPAPLLAHMTGAAPVRTVIVDRAAGGLPAGGHTGLDAFELLASPSTGDRLPEPAPCAAAYVMFTSGSTGLPKGVLLGHAGLAEYARALPAHLSLSGEDRCLGVAPLGFSSSIRELLLPLARGAVVVVPGEEEVRTPWGVPDLVREHRVTHLDLTPSYWRAVLDAMPAGELGDALASVRGVLFASEPLDVALAHRSVRLLPRARLWNTYGCTETTGIIAAHEVTGTESAGSLVPIGTPLGHVSFRTRPGDGELVVSGDAVALGYLPGGLPPDGGCAPRQWETGDRVTTVDGTMVWTGRTDRMLKVRGMRVAPETVEHHLRAYPGITQAAVVDAGERGVACVVARTPASAPLDARALTAWLRERLPGHMVPAVITDIPAWPVLPNGKTDHRLLIARHRPDPGWSPISEERDVAHVRHRT